jgi:hypothetical protein
MRTEVALLLYNRVDHGLAVLDSLVLAGVPHVRAFMDHSDDSAVQDAQERLLQGIAERRTISVDVHRHQRHLGLARSVRYALDEVFAHSESAILLEDDCVVRPGGLPFFLEGLGALQNDHRVRSLCGYLFPCPFIRSASEPLLLRRFCTWGWATWRDRWQDYDPDVARAVDRLATRNIRLEDVGADLATLCRSDEFLSNRADIWSISWILEHYATGTYSVYPCDSMIKNIGFDGSGRNCRPSRDFATGAADGPATWSFTQLFHCVENEEMLKRFLCEHGLKTYPPS